ncbi:hypothetical protein [Desulfosporosinus sp. OT]|uniref:hypothetical protein n=1 Tax=Desulfosporosinus sp. OT TaxID=913865 RepID=UPI000223A068|nr:hypothetical protein [Desulfosporosinus sp. OT]EGW37165.1 hypothetical protein DOT_4704 [Desulfosporosinus sp. OT]
MKYSEANLGRIFILRLEHGDRIPDTIENFAITHLKRIGTGNSFEESLKGVNKI